jgi:hypothetical protein
VRELVACVLLPQQTCETCCDELCSSWGLSVETGDVTIVYDSCIELQSIEETFTGPSFNTFCVLYGTTPVILSGTGILAPIQICGCCFDNCNTFRVIGVSGSVTISYTNCLDEEITDTFSNDTFFCCKKNTTPVVISGIGFISFWECGCED